jgi:PIN domain nuclease of toxin-antitoxin system
VTFRVDINLLIWPATGPDKLSTTAKSYIAEEYNQLFFSAASI